MRAVTNYLAPNSFLLNEGKGSSKPDHYKMDAAALLPSSRKRCAKEDEDTQLHIACYEGAYESALMHILSGQDLMCRNIWNQTPLHHCASQGHLDIMLLLLDSGATVNARDFQNLTPLHQAVIHSNKHASELLLCYGASVYNSQDVTDTLSVLELAGHVHVCHKLIAGAAGNRITRFHQCWLIS